MNHTLSSEAQQTIAVDIKQNATGIIRTYEIAIHRDDINSFLWSDGNYSCDCNRALFFGYAEGKEPHEIDATCSDGMYSVRVRNKLSPKWFYSEFED